MAGINYDTANTGYGGNYGGGYYNGSSILEIAALGLVFGDGLGRRGHDDYDKCCEKLIDCHDHHNDHNHEIDEIHDVEREVCASERLMGEGFRDVERDLLDAKYALSGDIKDAFCKVDKDVLEAKYDLGKEILEAKFENALQGKDIIREIDLQSCGINRNIDDVKFKQAIFAKEASAELAACCCELKEKIRDNIDAANKTASETQMLIIKTDAKNDLKEAERERRALERQIDALMADKRQRDGRDEQNILNNFGTITDSLNKVVTALGNTAS